MQGACFVLPEGTIKASPGLVRVTPTHMKEDLIFSGDLLVAIGEFQHQIYAFLDDESAFDYDLFATKRTASHDHELPEPELHFALQHRDQGDYWFGFGESPGMPGWGLRNRIVVKRKFVCSWLRAIDVATAEDDMTRLGRYGWALRGHDAEGRLFRISGRGLTYATGEAGNELSFARVNQDAWISLGELACEICDMGAGSMLVDQELDPEAPRVRADLEVVAPDRIHVEVCEDGKLIAEILSDSDFFAGIQILPALFWPKVTVNIRLLLVDEDDDDE